jgi:isoquinoline 1-oxidoreductase beta subunit
VQATGNSNAYEGSWQPLRPSGAHGPNHADRSRLRSDGRRSGVLPLRAAASCIHEATRRSATYGDPLPQLATMPVPAKVALKEPSECKLMARRPKRLDCTQAKIKSERPSTRLDARPRGEIATLRNRQVSRSA